MQASALNRSATISTKKSFSRVEITTRKVKYRHELSTPAVIQQVMTVIQSLVFGSFYGIRAFLKHLECELFHRQSTIKKDFYDKRLRNSGEKKFYVSRRTVQFASPPACGRETYTFVVSAR
jgi:hypothetical protein